MKIHWARWSWNKSNVPETRTAFPRKLIAACIISTVPLRILSHVSQSPQICPTISHPFFLRQLRIMQLFIENQRLVQTRRSISGCIRDSIWCIPMVTSQFDTHSRTIKCLRGPANSEPSTQSMRCLTYSRERLPGLEMTFYGFPRDLPPISDGQAKIPSRSFVRVVSRR
jgi:hypothetical protein